MCGFTGEHRIGTGNNGVDDKYFGSHELHGREHVVQGSSDRGFGYVFAGFAALVGALSLYKGGALWPYWLAGGVMFALGAFYRPRLVALQGRCALALLAGSGRHVRARRILPSESARSAQPAVDQVGPRPVRGR